MSIDAGMDIEEVERLAEALARSSNDLSTVITQLEKIVGNAGWVGPVSSRFKQQWWPKHRGQLASASSALADFGKVARANALEQRRASDAGAALIGTAVDGALGEFEETHRLLPVEVNKWWAGLSQEERDRFVNENPQLIGNLDGIPAEVRFTANKLAMQQRLEYLKAAGAPQDELGVVAGEVLGTRAPNPHQVEIDRLEEFLEGDRKFLVFDPTGDGRIAEVHGDLKTADNIVVFVPGIGNDLKNFDSTTGPQGQRLYDARTGDTAVISWMGYDAPSGIEADVVGDRSLASVDRAQEEAYRLVSFTEGLQATSGGSITVLGHSYGTVLATEAAKLGMEVDKVILAGSPGVQAENASVFNGADVYAIRNDYDPVSDFDPLGNRPTDPSFGATILEGNGMNPIAVVPGKVYPVLMPFIGLTNHSTFFDPGSTAIENIMGAVEGSRTTSDGYTVTRTVDDDGNAVDLYLPKF